MYSPFSLKPCVDFLDVKVGNVVERNGYSMRGEVSDNSGMKTRDCVGDEEYKSRNDEADVVTNQFVIRKKGQVHEIPKTPIAENMKYFFLNFSKNYLFMQKYVPM